VAGGRVYCAPRLDYDATRDPMKTACLACVLVALSLGCEEEVPPARTPAPLTDPQPQPNAQAAADARFVEKIATGTCDREASCGTIGPGATFATRDDCMKTAREKYAKELNPVQCPAGIEVKALEDCLRSLEANQCSQTGDVITRSARCPTKALCMK